MRTIYEDVNCSIIVNNRTSEVFHTNKNNGVETRIDPLKQGTTISYDNNELMPDSRNGLPCIRIKPRS